MKENIWLIGINEEIQTSFAKRGRRKTWIIYNTMIATTLRKYLRWNPIQDNSKKRMMGLNISLLTILFETPHESKML